MFNFSRKLFDFNGKNSQEYINPLPKSWIERAKSSAKFTPDILNLQLHGKVLLFVYNETMEGHRKHYPILGENAEFQGTAFTMEHNYSMWKKNLGKESFPIAIQGVESRIKPQTWNNKGFMQARIKGEIYLVDPKAIISLDEHVLNTVQFNRKRTKLIVPYYIKQNGRIVKSCHIVRAYMYDGILSYWEDLLDGGYTYSIVANREINEEFKFLSYAYHYSLAEHYGNSKNNF